MAKRSVLHPAHFDNLQIKEAVGVNSGLSICFADGAVLHARDGHILQNGNWIKIDSCNRNLRLFAKATVARAVFGKNSLNIHLRDRNAFYISSGFLVVNGRTFDINVLPGLELRERPIYCRDGV